MSDVSVVARHPRIVALPRTPEEAERVQGFALDLARWLVGDRDTLAGPLARVVTRVARRELRDAELLCHGRPLLAVEAAARAVEALWPLLRDPDVAEEPEPADEPEFGDPTGESPRHQEAGEPPPPRQGDEDQGDEDEGDGDDQDDGDAGDGDEDEDGQDGGDQGGQDGDGDGESDSPGGDLGDGDLGELPDDLADRLRRAFSPGGPGDDLVGEAAQAAAQGAIDADKVGRHLDRFLPGVGWSMATGALDRVLLERLDRLATLLERLDALQELADQIGRLEDASRRHGPNFGGSEEVVGVELGGEVTHALPSELGLLGDPVTEDLFYQRLLERRLVTLELTGGGLDGGAEGDRRGPVIACIDTSGSMEGAPELAAKALVLAVCRRALPKHRPVHLLLFGGPGERTEIRVRKGAAALDALIDFLGWSFRSGTDFDTPLERALELLDEQDLKRADILVVTDGLCRAGPHIVNAVEAARATRGVRVWSVVLGTAGTAGVEPFSDEVWQLDPEIADAGPLSRV